MTAESMNCQIRSRFSDYVEQVEQVEHMILLKMNENEPASTDANSKCKQNYA